MKRICIVCLTTILALFTSCEHKELCLLHPHTPDVEVVFDWRNVTNSIFPESMTVFFFPTEGGVSERYDFQDIKGGTIKISVGSYRVICLNRDTEANLMANINFWEKFEVYTRTTDELQGLSIRSTSVPRAEGTEDQPMLITPDRLWTDRLANVEIDEHEGQQVILCPEVSTCTYTVEINQVKNLRYVIGLSASLSGMGNSFLIGPERHEGIGTLSFELGHDANSQIKGQFYTLCHCNSLMTLPHYLVVYAVMSDGSKFYYTYDVTDQVHYAPDPYHVHIVIDELSLPQPISDDSGFLPTVDDWEDEEIDLNM